MLIVPSTQLPRSESPNNLITNTTEVAMNVDSQPSVDPTSTVQIPQTLIVKLILIAPPKID